MIIFRNEHVDQISSKKLIDSICQDVLKNDILLVGIMLDRSPILLYLLKQMFDQQIAFIIIDPLLPKERIQFIVNDSKIRKIITQVKYYTYFSDIERIYIDDYKVIETVSRFKDCIRKENEIAYILYTSGTSGVPKGVIISREAFLNFIAGISEVIDYSSRRRILCLTTVSFDIFLLESLMALIKGLTIVLADDEDQQNPKRILSLIKDNSIDIIQLTPSRMQQLLNYDKNLLSLKNVKEILIGGEVFPYNLLQALQEKTTARLYNMYGPTESTIWSTLSDLTNKEEVDIGYPIKNTEVYIIDDRLNLVPDGQSGEIFIVGKGIALGYVGRDELTKEKFVHLSHRLDARGYRTGDFGGFNEDGHLQYLGRIDNQVKINGFRIELEEIEFHIHQFKGINQSIVLDIKLDDNSTMLRAFYTSETSIKTADIVEYLSTKVPSYMIPAIFNRIEDFPLTPNGKIDRKKMLESIQINRAKTKSQISDSFEENNNFKQKILNIILRNSKELGSVEAPLDLKLSTVGLDSISFIKVIAALEEEFDFDFDDEMLLMTNFLTIGAILNYVSAKIGKDENKLSK